MDSVALLAAFVALDTLKAGGATRVFREQGAAAATLHSHSQAIGSARAAAKARAADVAVLSTR